MTNPIESWTWGQTCAMLVLAFTGTVLVAAWIQHNDVALAGRRATSSAALEWIFQQDGARDVVEDWDKHGVARVATHGTLIDTFAFIPFYSTLLALIGFAAARDLPPGWFRHVALAVGWSGWLAGVLDVLENTGIFVELELHRYAVAPLTGTVCYAKWTTVGACAVFTVSWIGYEAVLLVGR